MAGLPAPAARKVCVDNRVVRGAACCLRQARQGLHASVGCEFAALMAAKTSWCADDLRRAGGGAAAAD